MKIEKLDIIARDSNDRGLSFEFLIMSLLDSMGYTDINPRVRKTGMEIDIKAKHKVIKNNIICECKAYQRRIEAKDLQYFFGKLKHQRSKDRNLRGFFFSVSGFSGTANEWYDELSVSEKRNFEIYDKEELVILLLQYDMIIGEQKLNQILEKNNTSNLQLGTKHIVLFRSMLFIIQFFNLMDRPYRYLVLTSKGEMAGKTITKKIKGLRVKTSELIVDSYRIEIRTPLNKTLGDTRDIVRDKAEWILRKQEQLKSSVPEIKKTNI